MGAGVAGCAMAKLLKGEHEVEIFDRTKKLGCGCAWGVSWRSFKKIVKKLGLNPQDYLLNKIKWAYVYRGIKLPLRNLAIIRKPRLLWDLLDGMEVKNVKEFRREKYDVIVDATGVERALLGPVEGGIVHTLYQELVETDRFSPDTVYFIDKPNAIEGYFWIFPAGRYFHFGYGFIDKDLPKIKWKRICRCSKEVSLLPPSKCRPFFKENIVGVGSAIGAINPLTAEGIVPSLQSALLLYENFNDWQAYEKAVLKKFKHFDALYEFGIGYKEGNWIKMIKGLPAFFAEWFSKF